MTILSYFSTFFYFDEREIVSVWADTVCLNIDIPLGHIM